MDITISSIERKFDKFNRQMFGGRLPKPVIELSNARSFLGLCVYKQRRLPNGRVENCDFRLRFSKCIDIAEQELEDTIIHEMIHYYIAVNNLPDISSHGILFRRIMQDINRRHGRHITISHRSTDQQGEPAADTRRRWHVVALVALASGNTGVKVLPRVVERILRYYNLVSESPKVNSMQLYMTDDPFFNRYPTSSALRVTHIDREEAMAHLADASVIECDGKSMEIDGKRYSIE